MLGELTIGKIGRIRILDLYVCSGPRIYGFSDPCGWASLAVDSDAGFVCTNVHRSIQIFLYSSWESYGAWGKLNSALSEMAPNILLRFTYSDNLGPFVQS